MQHVSMAEQREARLLVEDWSANLFDDKAFEHSESGDIFETLAKCEHNRFYYIKTADNSELVGVAYLTDFEPIVGGYFTATLCAAIKRKFWGTSVLDNGHFFVGYLLDNTPLKRLKAEVFVTNPLPKRTLKSLGFSRTDDGTVKTVVKGRLTTAETYVLEGKRA